MTVPLSAGILLKQDKQKMSLTHEGLTYTHIKDRPIGGPKWLSILERQVILPNGDEKSFEIMDTPDAVFVLPFCTKTQTVTLVQEYYPGPNKWSTGLIAGLYEKDKHTSPLEAAKFELEEEAHLCGGTWISLMSSGGESEGLNGKPIPYGKYTTQQYYPYVVVDPEVCKSPRSRDPSEFICIDSHIDVNILIEKVFSGEMTVPNTAGALLAINKLRALGMLPPPPK